MFRIWKQKITIRAPSVPKKYQLNIYMYVCMYVCVCMYIYMPKIKYNCNHLTPSGMLHQKLYKPKEKHQKLRRIKKKFTYEEKNLSIWPESFCFRTTRCFIFSFCLVSIEDNTYVSQMKNSKTWLRESNMRHYSHAVKNEVSMFWFPTISLLVLLSGPHMQNGTIQ